MNKPTSLALLAAGIILLIYGNSASESIGSGFHRMFTGAPTDKTVWMLIGGVVASIAGIAGLLGKSKA